MDNEIRLPGVSSSRKKSGEVYYRAGITFRSKHISLGSSSSASEAHEMYLEGKRIISTSVQLNEYVETSPLAFDKWVCLINFRENRVYFKNPIYLKKQKYFSYYISPELELKFDNDDLFYYSEHRIQVRGGHFFCEDFGTQISLKSRYGIRPFAVEGRDYRFVNKDETDYRYENIEIINRYMGVEKRKHKLGYRYRAKIHVNGDFILGTYDTEEEAAIAYNKALDLLLSKGLKKTSLHENYLENLPSKEYAEIYRKITFSEKFMRILDEI
ncbi:MAG: hypothetical protein J6P05_07405 [Lachnospiraceae bacterium]|nr:hypothetical protein [Lachnospiraceae bacterium]